MYFFETIIFIIVGAFLVFIGFIFGKKSKDSYNDLKDKFNKNKK